jgi:integrase
MKRNRKRRKPETVKTGNVVVKIYRRDKIVKFKRTDGSSAKKEYRVYEVEDFTTGTRRLQSLSDHAEAQALAKKIADQLAGGKVEAASMTNAAAASYGRAVELLRPTGATLETAADVYARAWKVFGEDRIVEAILFLKRHGASLVQRRTVAETVSELLEIKRKRTQKGRPASDRYIKDLSTRLEKFARDFAVDISNITTPDIQGWIDKLEVAPQTAKNFRTVLGTLFQFAESRGYTLKGANPMDGVESISANGGAIEIYTPDEIAALLTAASEDFLPVVALGAFAGLRAAEIERIEWSNIDIAGGHIEVAADKAKTRSRRLVPVLPNLAQWLANYSNRKGKVWTGTDKEMRTARADAVAKAQTPWKDNALRHSFISYRLAEIKNAAQVALEAGNSPAMVFKHYRELVKPEAAKAWFAIAPEQPANVISMTKEAAR